MPRLSGLISGPRWLTARWAMCSARSALRSSSGRIKQEHRPGVAASSASDRPVDQSCQTISSTSAVRSSTTWSPSTTAWADVELPAQQRLGGPGQGLGDEGEQLDRPGRRSSGQIVLGSIMVRHDPTAGDNQEFAYRSRIVHLWMALRITSAPARVWVVLDTREAGGRSWTLAADRRSRTVGGPSRRSPTLLDEAPTSKFHRRAVLISGMGFFTDAYDLFVIGTVAALVKTQWHLSHHADELGDRIGDPGGLRRCLRLRSHRRRPRAQDGLHRRGGHHDRRRARLGARARTSSSWSSPASSSASASAATTRSRRCS